MTARSEIVSLVEKRVTAFELGRRICLVTDWSRVGIGYVLWQKKWKCTNIRPSCCEGGWEIIMVGSRFCTPAESRYAPIEGSCWA